MHIVRIQRLSNSLVVTIPRWALSQLKWKRGDNCVVEVADGKLRFRNINNAVIGPTASKKTSDDIPADFAKEGQ